MFGQQPPQLNGFMGAANPHPMFSTMLGAPAGNVDVTMTAAQMQQFQAQIQLGYQAQMAEAAKQKEAADAKAATEQQGLITSAVQAAVGAIVPKPSDSQAEATESKNKRPKPVSSDENDEEGAATEEPEAEPKMSKAQRRKTKLADRVAEQASAPLREEISSLETELQNSQSEVKFIKNSLGYIRSRKTRRRGDSGALTDDENDKEQNFLDHVVQNSAEFAKMSPDSKLMSRQMMMDQLKSPARPKAVAKCKRAIQDDLSEDGTVKSESIDHSESASVDLMAFVEEPDPETEAAKPRRGRSGSKTFEITGIIAELSQALAKCSKMPTEFPNLTASFKKAASSSVDMLQSAVTKQPGYEMQMEGMLKDKWGIKLPSRDLRLWLLATLKILRDNKVAFTMTTPSEKPVPAPATPDSGAKPKGKGSKKKKK